MNCRTATNPITSILWKVFDPPTISEVLCDLFLYDIYVIYLEYLCRISIQQNRRYLGETPRGVIFIF